MFTQQELLAITDALDISEKSTKRAANTARFAEFKTIYESILTDIASCKAKISQNKKLLLINNK